MSLFSAFLALGCQSAATAPAAGPAPAACGKDFAARTPLLELAPTQAPQNLPRGKSAPYQFAVALPVGKNAEEHGRWTGLDRGWFSLGIRLSSGQALTLSLHLKPVALPQGAELWLCSAGGSPRQGPFRDIASGELYTPVVPGAEAWLEVLTPAAHKNEVKLGIVEAFGGFR